PAHIHSHYLSVHVVLTTIHTSNILSFIHTAPTQIYTLSLHDALPISNASTKSRPHHSSWISARVSRDSVAVGVLRGNGIPRYARDRKSTRLNSSHVKISYAVFCLKKKK